MHQIRPPAALALLLLFALSPRPLDGHEVPARVAVSAWIVPRDSVVDVYVRVPLEAMRDLDFPLRADSMLDLVRVRELLPTAATTWIASGITVWADGRERGAGRVTAARLSLPDDRAFESLESVATHFAAAPLDNAHGVPWRNALFDVHLQFSAPALNSAARLDIRSTLAHLGVRTTSVFRLVRLDGAVRAFTFAGDAGRIALEPGWWQSARRFLADGIGHILGGLDHLVFVLCLVLPIRRWRPLVAIVTAFTLAHSLTLGAAALDWVPAALWFPPLIEVLIALSILWLAIENVLLTEQRLGRRWVLAFAFGLVHGVGFSFALAEELQFAGAHLVTALGAFNVGVEVGQLAALAVAVPVLRALRARVGEGRQHLIVWVGSALIAHTAWHWMTARFSALGAFRDGFVAPALDGAFALGALRFALLAALALALGLALRQILRRFLPE